MAKKDYSVKSLTAGDFPLPVRHFWTNTVGNAKIRLATTLASIVCCCFLSTRLRVKYVYDAFLSMLLLNLLVIKPSGSGKSLVRLVVNMLVKTQILRDLEERRKLQANRGKNRRRATNRVGEEEYPAAVRVLQSFTPPAIVKYADNSARKFGGEPLSFLLFSDEIGVITDNRRYAGIMRDIARTAYSLGEIYARDTAWEGGVNTCVDICWCSVLCGQESALEKYIDKQGVIQGDASRQILVKDDDTLGEDAPTLRPFTEQQQRDIEGAVSRLMGETFTDDGQLQPIHEVDMKWLDKDVKMWCGQQREIILKTGSRAHESFYVRASVSAFRIATMLYHLWDEAPSKQKQVRRCYWYFAQLILDAQMAQWGQEYESALPKEKECTQKPTLFDSMPKRFTRDQLREAVIKQELGTPARIFLHKWLSKKWIYEAEKDVFEKFY